jgi:pimeloyl-ACP methyl ester carboxylesterase
MYAPGGLDASMDKWRTLGIYQRIRLLEHLPGRYRCILFDRRESGGSGGRVEALGWMHYVAQGKGLLEHLGIGRAHLMGACMGCAVVAAFAAAHPRMVQSMVLYWPVGGARYRIANHQRFAAHLEHVDRHGPAGVATLAASSTASFAEDPRVGPWAGLIRRDPAFAEAFRARDREEYRRIVAESCRALYDRDTAPGAEPEALMRLEIPALIVPGRDPSHATSAARYLEECLAAAQYWDVVPAAQTAYTAPARVLRFLDRQSRS